MFKIVHNKIYMTRGDTVRFDIELGNLQYHMSKIYFIVTSTPTIVDIRNIDEHPEDYLFYREGTDIEITPDDTLLLEKDTYYYQIRAIVGESEDINTLVEPESLILTPIGR